MIAPQLARRERTGYAAVSVALRLGGRIFADLAATTEVMDRQSDIV
jgi:hypothetical protein